MFYSAEQAAKLIAPYVGGQWPQNKDSLFRTLTLINDKIWKEGSWWGMTAEFFLKTRVGPEGERYMVTPPGYDILKAVNVEGRPVLNRDRWFQFHKNGCGTIDKSSGNWTDTVVDLGEYPTINDISIINQRPNKILIGACYTGKEDVGLKKVRIEGEWDREGPVLTYGKEKFADNKVEFLNEEENYETVFGAEIALSNNIRFIENVWWKRITSIHKDITVNPVEVYAIHSDNTLQLLSVMQPHQTMSKHRRYLAPDECKCSCTSSCKCEYPIHAMLKISEPEEISYNTQSIYTRDREALISLAIGIDEMFGKKSPGTSIPFTLNGIKNLEDHNRESQSDDVFPIQMVGPYIDDIPEEFRYFSH